jgi:hypothetical protein
MERSKIHKPFDLTDDVIVYNNTGCEARTAVDYPVTDGIGGWPARDGRSDVVCAGRAGVFEKILVVEQAQLQAARACIYD